MMALNYADILIAINRVLGHREGIEQGFFEKGLAEVLINNKERGRFDGTVESALKCFEDEGYDVSSIRSSIKKE